MNLWTTGALHGVSQSQSTGQDRMSIHSLVLVNHLKPSRRQESEVEGGSSVHTNVIRLVGVREKGRSTQKSHVL